MLGTALSKTLINPRAARMIDDASACKFDFLHVSRALTGESDALPTRESLRLDTSNLLLKQF